MVRSVWILAVGVMHFALIAILSGCVPVHVTTETAPDANFSRFESYAQDPVPEDTSPTPRYSPKVLERVQSEIATVLDAKGYRQRSSPNADMTVRFRVSGQSSVRMVNAADPDTDFDVPEEFAEGTLIISIFEGDDGKRLWRGSGDTEVMTAGALIRGNPEKALIESVQKVLADFPEAQRASN